MYSNLKKIKKIKINKKNPSDLYETATSKTPRDKTYIRAQYNTTTTHPLRRHLTTLRSTSTRQNARRHRRKHRLAFRNGLPSSPFMFSPVLVGRHRVWHEVINSISSHAARIGLPARAPTALKGISLKLYAASGLPWNQHRSLCNSVRARRRRRAITWRCAGL